MSSPRTAAGRALLEWGIGPGISVTLTDAILAIEAEAAAPDYVTEYRAEDEAMERLAEAKEREGFDG